MGYKNGEILTTQVSVYYYPAQWDMGQGATWEIYEFTCTGFIRRLGVRPAEFRLDGARTETPLPKAAVGSHHPRGPVLEPLRATLERKLGITVRLFTASVIEAGTD